MTKETNDRAMVALKYFIRKYPIGEFKPFIRFIEGLNCIEILVRDCSVCEREITPEISALIDIHKKDQIGIIFWGVSRNSAVDYLRPEKREKLLGMLQILVDDHRDVCNFITELGGRTDLCVEPIL